MKRHIRWLREFFAIMSHRDTIHISTQGRIADLEHQVFVLGHILNEQFPQTVPWFMTEEDINRKLKREIDDLSPLPAPQISAEKRASMMATMRRVNVV